MTFYFIMTAVVCTFAYLAAKDTSSVISLTNKIAIKKSTIYLASAFIILTLVSGLRWEVGVDHLNYYYVFYNVRDHLNVHVEIGFRLLCKLILLFTQNLSVLFFISALITATFTFIAIKENSTNLFISTFLYLTMGFYFYSMNSIRHYMALSIYMVAFKYIKERKFIPYVLLILLAACFHKIALVALPLYFLLNIKYKAYYYGIFSVALIIVSIFHRQILDFIYQYVFDFYRAFEQENTTTSYLNIGICLALTILSFMYQEKLLQRNKSNIILVNSAYFGLMFFALCSWIPVYTRIGQYLTILSLFLIPEILHCEERPKIKKLYYIGLIVGFIAFLAVMLINAKNPNIQLVPYHSIFNK